MDTYIKKDQHFWHFMTASAYGLLSVLLVVILKSTNEYPTNITFFDFLMLALATFRVTRLLVHDLVSDFIRDPFADAKSGIKLSIHDLLDCPWCTGAWVSLGLGYFYFLSAAAWPIILILAMAGFGSLLTILASLMMVKLNGK